MSSKEYSSQKSIIEHWYGKKKDLQYPIARYMSNKCNFDYQKCSKKRKTTNNNNKEKKILHNQLNSVTKENSLPQLGTLEITSIQNYSII